MKKLDFLLLFLFSGAAALLRARELRTGFDRAGLPVGGAASLALPLVLTAAAAVFLLLARAYGAQRGADGGTDGYFDFSGTLPVTLCVLGAFTLIAGAVLTLVSPLRTLSVILLAVLRFAAGAAVIYALFALRRGGTLPRAALLTPVYALVVQLVFTYRATAVDPVLSHFYVEILALAALAAAFLEFSAFAFRSGAPRVFLPLADMAVVLCVCTAVGARELPTLLLYSGFALVLFGYCAAVNAPER